MRRFSHRVAQPKQIWVCRDCDLYLTAELHGTALRHCPSCGSGGLHKFQSGGEASRWAQLRLLLRAGCINQLERQPRFNLHAVDPGGGRHYIGFVKFDFRYEENGVVQIEDYHPTDTSIARWKRRHFEIEYGVTILLTGVEKAPSTNRKGRKTWRDRGGLDRATAAT